MATLLYSRPCAPAVFGPTLGPGTFALLRITSEEFSRALVAVHRYEELRTSNGRSAAERGRAPSARQVFTELYADG
jgi:hypothetical protein